MANTFYIRLEKTAGLAGQLHVDSEGISFSTKRGLLTLFTQRTRRISASNIKEVYREGDAVRVEFATTDTEREVFPFWAKDRDSAAEIMRVMPTTHTIEMEAANDGDLPRAATPRNRRTVALIFGLLGLLAGAVLTIFLRESPAPPVVDKIPTADVVQPRDAAIAPSANATERKSDLGSESGAVAPARAPSGSSSTDLPERVSTPVFSDAVRDSDSDPIDTVQRGDDSIGTVDEASAWVSGKSLADQVQIARDAPASLLYAPIREGIVAIIPGMLDYAAARAQMNFFESASASIRADYLYLPSRPSAERLEALESRWWQLSVDLYNSAEFDHMRLRPQIWAELAASRSWREFLSSYAAALRTGSDAGIAAALAEREVAESLEMRARMYVR